ncbi:hypothetical protein AOXY_G6532 [Acipenser oxyrinchus oxyrinchus]|uniref:Uncharacterized protein n=1 Tax=Acipenser oxyrinchus oxyrinchus TaxID=40147 RepID=A0AAD8GC94_ACIOX|nr:hypothetical protein AOXY_G6532 [Acipenser oxyrinchus oxyrinchus]
MHTNSPITCIWCTTSVPAILARIYPGLDPTVSGGVATWESGPATIGQDMQVRCLGAQAEGSNSQAPSL